MTAFFSIQLYYIIFLLALFMFFSDYSRGFLVHNLENLFMIVNSDSPNSCLSLGKEVRIWWQTEYFVTLHVWYGFGSNIIKKVNDSLSLSLNQLIREPKRGQIHGFGSVSHKKRGFHASSNHGHITNFLQAKSLKQTKDFDKDNKQCQEWFSMPKSMNKVMK